MRARHRWLAILSISTTAVFASSCGDGNGTDDAGGANDAGSAIDAGDADGGAEDAGTIDSGPGDDAGATDSGVSDSGSVDAGDMDSGSSDAGTPDAGTSDAGVFDAGVAVSSCGDLSDAQLMAAVYGGPKVPPGFYFEMPGPMEGLQWRTPCSASLADTRTRAEMVFPGALTGVERSTPFFHEVTTMPSTFTFQFRNTRCDYFDGATLAGSPILSPAPLKELADYLWFTQNHNFGGAHIIAGIEDVGSATQRYRLCHVSTVYGDFGLCDMVTLHTRAYSVVPDGSVTVSPDTSERTIMGMCR